LLRVKIRKPIRLDFRDGLYYISSKSESEEPTVDFDYTKRVTNARYKEKIGEETRSIITLYRKRLEETEEYSPEQFRELLDVLIEEMPEDKKKEIQLPRDFFEVIDRLYNKGLLQIEGEIEKEVNTVCRPKIVYRKIYKRKVPEATIVCEEIAEIRLFPSKFYFNLVGKDVSFPIEWEIRGPSPKYLKILYDVSVNDEGEHHYIPRYVFESKVLEREISYLKHFGYKVEKRSSGYYIVTDPDNYGEDEEYTKSIYITLDKFVEFLKEFEKMVEREKHETSGSEA